MYKILTKAESEAFNLDIPMNMGVTDGSVASMKYLIAPIRMRIELEETEDVSVLKFKDTSNLNIMEIMRLRRVECPLTNMTDIYEAICRKAIKRFELYALTWNRKELVIWTSDNIIMEILATTIPAMKSK